MFLVNVTVIVKTNVDSIFYLVRSVCSLFLPFIPAEDLAGVLLLDCSTVLWFR